MGCTQSKEEKEEPPIPPLTVNQPQSNDESGGIDIMEVELGIEEEPLELEFDLASLLTVNPSLKDFSASEGIGWLKEED